MMRRKTHIRHIVLILSLIYLFLSAFTVIGAEKHALDHERRANHAAQHASFICTWMCAASTFVHSADQKVSQRLHPSFENLTLSIEFSLKDLSIFSFYIRPPPNALP